jgi:hypothetical protein
MLVGAHASGHSVHDDADFVHGAYLSVARGRYRNKAFLNLQPLNEEQLNKFPEKNYSIRRNRKT